MLFSAVPNLFLCQVFNVMTIFLDEVFEHLSIFCTVILLGFLNPSFMLLIILNIVYSLFNTSPEIS